MSRSGRTRWSRGSAALAALVLLALGVLAGVGLAPQDPPSSVAAGRAPERVAVATQPFDDARQVELTTSVGPVRAVVSPVAGRLTAFDCRTGGRWQSGTSPLSVDGDPLIALATVVPFYRDLTPGASGADVDGLQRELARLGFDAPRTGLYDLATRTAVGELLTQVTGERRTGRILSAAEVVWLPARTVVVGTCDVSPGATVEAGLPVASAPGPLRALSVNVPPPGSAAGARVLTVETVSTSVDKDGAVTDPEALARITETSLYQTSVASEGAVGLTATWALATPLEVLAVPPGSLIGLGSSQSCVDGDDGIVPVTVVSSVVGQSLVSLPAGTRPPRSVAVAPAAGASCG